MRVVTELVINHTSDQHPWFQEARQSKSNPRRDWYVWSDTPDTLSASPHHISSTPNSPIGHGILFPKSYYWHRFFSHQPDLNYDHPVVREADLERHEVLAGYGSGRLPVDAVPYLVEREETNCENLAETHQVFKDLRAELAQKYPDRIFLAEANQWPEDAVAYFGDGDECHMAFHFPLMPRMFMAIRLEDRKPIIEIMHSTPAIPESCQWGLFLRNHDELTLEMVTNDERDYFYDEYAKDKCAAQPRNSAAAGAPARKRPPANRTDE